MFHHCIIFQADEYINNLIKELESREKTFQSLSKTTIYLDIDQKHPGFFTKESFNDCTEEDICRIKQKSKVRYSENSPSTLYP